MAKKARENMKKRNTKDSSRDSFDTNPQRKKTKLKKNPKLRSLGILDKAADATLMLVFSTVLY